MLLDEPLPAPESLAAALLDVDAQMRERVRQVSEFLYEPFGPCAKRAGDRDDPAVLAALTQQVLLGLGVSWDTPTRGERNMAVEAAWRRVARILHWRSRPRDISLGWKDGVLLIIATPIPRHAPSPAHIHHHHPTGPEPCSHRI